MAAEKGFGTRLVALVVVTLCWSIIGFVITGWITAQMLPSDRGLAGGAEVLFAALIGGCFCGGSGLIAALLMKGRPFQILCLTSLLLGLTVGAVLLWRIASIRAAEVEPDEAYAGIPGVVVSVETLVVRDPYLRVELEIDAKQKRFTSTGPGPTHQICRGRVASDQLRAVVAAVEALEARGTATEPSCDAANPEKRIVWRFHDGRSGSLEVGPDCLEAVPEVSALIRAMDRATFVGQGRIRCD